MPADFTPAQRAILAMAQGDIPDSPAPFADMARAAGLGEGETLELLRQMKASGAIRRFGATIRHNRAGWKANAMVAWRASREQADALAPIAAGHANISHAYFRPSPAPDWPYTLYTMIHGRDEAECLAVLDWLLASWPLRDYAILRTKRELKKTSMAYFG